MKSRQTSARVRDPDAKRAAVMTAGEALFSRQGFGPTKMGQIAEEAGVAVGTVYRLFPDKASLLAALHKSVEDGFIAAMKDGWRRGTDFEDSFDCMIDAVFSELVRIRDIMPLYAMTKDLVGASNHQPGARMIREIETLYAQAVDAGTARAFPPSFQAIVGHAMLEGAFRAWMANPTPKWRRTVQKETQTLFKRAFLHDPAV